jgi:uncharacterized membrane protein
MGTVIGKMNNGTVNWLNRANDVNTRLAVKAIVSASMLVKMANVTKVTSIVETCARNAKYKKMRYENESISKTKT